MKDSLGAQLKQMLSDAINYCKMQIEEGKLVGAQKVSMLISAAAVAVICLVIGLFALLFFAFALASLLANIFAPWLALILVGAALLIILLIIVLLRKVIIIDPVCRFLTRLLFDNDPK